MWSNSRYSAHRWAFTVLEVIIALTILGIGMVGLIRLFPMGLEASTRAENNTRAAILAQEIMESLKADAQGLPFIEGETVGFGIPGNGLDDDDELTSSPGSFDRNCNLGLDADFDGGYVDRFSGGECSPGSDGLPDFVTCGRPTVNSPCYNYSGLILITSHQWHGDANGDGDPYYDPENSPGVGVDEGYPYTDSEGRIAYESDVDNMLATNIRGGEPDPLSPGDGLDNDGDGEEGSPTVRVMLYSYPPDPSSPPTSPRWVELKVADGIDNNGDGRIDEGIDEEIFDFQDNDGDGLVDEDCRLAAYPFTPRRFRSSILLPDSYTQEQRGRFESPNERFAWQVFVGRVSDGGGDGLDNDGDGYIDEDPLDGIDNDLDGRFDEDPSPMPLPGYRKVVVRITWGGDEEDNDEDGRLDEELSDGLDNDFDGFVDEDTYRYFYELTGYVQLKT